MSNSIWHKPGHQPAVGDKAKVSRDGGLIYWTAHGWNRPGEDVHDIGVEWAYLEDVLAQADKAERLQKAVNTALISIGTAAIFDGEDAKKYAEAKIDLIKQLTKGE